MREAPGAAAIDLQELDCRLIDRAVVALVRTDETIARTAVRLGFYGQPRLTRASTWKTGAGCRAIWRRSSDRISRRNPWAPDH